MKFLSHATVFLLFAVLAGCAAAASEHEGTRRNPNLITAAEIQASAATDVHELIESARPSWLRPRGLQSARPDGGGGTEIMVYLNQARLGGPGELRQMPVGGITSIQYVDARTATQRWGTGHTAGAIVISTEGPGLR